MYLWKVAEKINRYTAGNNKKMQNLRFFSFSSNLSEPVKGRATNNMAEIQAVTRGVEIACDNGIRKLRIHTDSEFLIKCITQWMPGWKRRGWRTASGNPVVNRAELQAMETALGHLFDVDWVRSMILSIRINNKSRKLKKIWKKVFPGLSQRATRSIKLFCYSRSMSEAIKEFTATKWPTSWPAKAPNDIAINREPKNPQGFELRWELDSEQRHAK